MTIEYQQSYNDFTGYYSVAVIVVYQKIKYRHALLGKAKKGRHELAILLNHVRKVIKFLKPVKNCTYFFWNKQRYWMKFNREYDVA